MKGKTRSDKTHLYFIAGGGLVKIGCTQDIQERFSQLQFMSPVKLEILAVFENMGHLEKRLHSTLYRYRKHGEWFEPSDKVMEMLDKLKKECWKNGEDKGNDRHIQQAKEMFKDSIHRG